RDAFIGVVGISADSSFLYYATTLIIALMFLIPAYKTIRWIGYVDYVAAPAILLVLIITVAGALELGGGILEIMKKSPATTGSIMVLLTTAAGGWLHGNTVISDFTRFYKNEKQATLGLLLTFGVLMVFQYVGATLGALATGEWNIFL